MLIVTPTQTHSHKGATSQSGGQTSRFICNIKEKVPEWHQWQLSGLVACETSGQLELTIFNPGPAWYWA